MNKEVAISQFIEDFQKIFPNILTNEEIKERLNANVSSVSIVDEIGPNRAGDYSLITKEIRVRKDQNINKILFHEMTHALTREINTEKDKRYISEVLTTLCEEEYSKYYKIEMKNNRTNGYIPDFGRQLQIVYGDELLKKFYQEPGKMHELFDVPYFSGFIKDGMQKKTFDKFSVTYKEVVDNVNNDNQTYLEESIRSLEEMISDQLKLKIEKTNSKEDLVKLEKLYSMQHYPDYQRYISIIESSLRKGIIQQTDISSLIQLCNLYSISTKNNDKEIKDYVSKRKLNKQNYEYISMKLFGFDNYTDTALDNSKYLNNQYSQNRDFYNCISEKIIDGEMDMENIVGCSFSKENAEDTTKDVQVILKKGAIDGYQRIISALQREEPPKYFILQGNNLKYVIEDGILYTDMPLADFYKNLKETNVDMTELIKYLNKNQVTNVHLDEYNLSDLKEILDENEEYNFYLQEQDGTIDRVVISGTKKLEVKYALIASSVPKNIIAEEELRKTR